jgi:hypothetical protein
VTARVVARFLDREQFVNAIAPKGDLTRIGRSQYAPLFRVADTSKRGLLSWDDFMVFQTVLKRPDADYYIAFQYFDMYACALFSAHDWGQLTTVTCPWRTVMDQGQSLSRNSKACSRPKLALTQFHLILTGTLLMVVKGRWWYGLNGRI